MSLADLSTLILKDTVDAVPASERLNGLDHSIHS
jgi:hypothetical protein